VPSSARRRLAEAALAVASIAVFLLLAEAATRVLGLADERPTGYAPVNTRRREGRPTNSLGYRDVERELSKPAGVRRVVSLGDSFAWGVGIEYDDTYARRVERALSRRPGERWEVVQLARPGMGTVEQAEQLAEEGFSYGPDVVVLGFVLNDSEDEDAAEVRRARDWEQARRERQERRSGGRLLDRSALWRFLAGRIEATVQNRRRLEAYRSQFLPGYPGWVACRSALGRMGAMCREHDVPFVVMIFPLFADPLDEHYPFADIHAQVAQVAGEAGAVVIDLLPAFRGLRSSLLVVDGANDEHPNEIAHRIAAQQLLRTLDRLFPPTSQVRAALPAPGLRLLHELVDLSRPAAEAAGGLLDRLAPRAALSGQRAIQCHRVLVGQRSDFGRPGHDQHDLPLHRLACGERGAKRRKGGAHVLFVQLRGLAAEERVAVSEKLHHVRKAVHDAHRGLVEHERRPLPGQPLEDAAARTRAGRQEADEEKTVGREAGDRQGQGRGARAGHRHDRQAFLPGVAHEAIARVGDSRRAGIGDEGDVAAGPQGAEDPLPLPPLVLLEVGGRGGCDGVGAQENAGPACVLAGHEGGLAQHAQGAQGEVLQVADRRRDDEERAGTGGTVGHLTH